jgi:putative membrane protein
MTDRIARQISFFAPAAVMSAWATVMLHTVASGHINRLLSPMFHNYVIIAAVLLFLLSALYVLLYQPTTAEAAPALAPTGRLRQLGRWLVLLVPVVAASVLSPSAVSSTTWENHGLNSTTGVPPMPSINPQIEDNIKDALAADPNQPVAVEVTDLITLGQKPAQSKAFDGREVRAIGFRVEQPGSATKLVRGLMWCCAADIQPVSVDLTGNVAGDWKDTDWLEVTGKARFPSKGGHVVPTIEVESIKTTQEPDEPYLSP